MKSFLPFLLSSSITKRECKKQDKSLKTRRLRIWGSVVKVNLLLNYVRDKLKTGWRIERTERKQKQGTKNTSSKRMTSNDEARQWHWKAGKRKIEILTEWEGIIWEETFEVLKEVFAKHGSVKELPAWDDERGSRSRFLRFNTCCWSVLVLSMPVAVESFAAGSPFFIIVEVVDLTAITFLSMIVVVYDEDRYEFGRKENCTQTFYPFEEEVMRAPDMRQINMSQTKRADYMCDDYTDEWCWWWWRWVRGNLQ